MKINPFRQVLNSVSSGRFKIYNINGNFFVKFCIIALTFLFCLPLKSQYVVTISTDTYSNLVGATPLNYIPADGGYYFNTNFIFPTFNRNADFNLNLNPPSLGGFLSTEGYIAIYEKPGYFNTIVYQCYYDSSLKRVAGITTVSAKIEGTGVNKIAKFEWRNLVRGMDTSQRVNFQVWLHQNDSSISYRYGTNTLNSRAIQGNCGMIVIDSTFYNTLDEIHVEGSPKAPTTYTGITTFAYPTLDSLPEKNTTIWFAKRPKVQSTVGIEEKEFLTDLSFYPNPCQETIRIKGLKKGGKIIIYDVLGNLVFENELQATQNEIEVSNLLPGIYTIKLVTQDAILTRRVIKN